LRNLPELPAYAGERIELATKHAQLKADHARLHLDRAYKAERAAEFIRSRDFTYDAEAVYEEEHASSMNLAQASIRLAGEGLFNVIAEQYLICVNYNASAFIDYLPQMCDLFRARIDCYGLEETLRIVASEMSVAWADRACREQDRIVTGSLRAGTQKLQWNKYGPERFGLLKYSQTITCQQVRWVFGLYQFSCIPLI
jgi:hypothetical protein